MRTYSRTPKSGGSKKEKNKKLMYGLLISLSVIVIATAVTLSVVLPNRFKQVPETPVVTPPVEQKKEFVVPLKSFELLRHAELDKVIYTSSLNQWRTHNGLDLKADKDSEVGAICNGTVLKVYYDAVYAGVVVVDHGDGLVATYMGLNRTLDVKEGAEVKAGDKLGTVAAVMPFERDDGPHLHLETKENDTLVDPLKFLPDIGDK